MNIIEIKKIDELNYEVCEHILRNRLYNVHIHSTSPKIIESLMVYMTEIGIPWDSIDNGYGIAVHEDNGGDLHQIYITADKETVAAKKDEYAVAFLLRNIEQEKINALVTDPETFDLGSVPIHLQNEEIRKMFLKTFMIAESEIDIISPWMNYSVVNAALVNLMRNALQRGVSIRIRYGLAAGHDEYNQIRSERSDQVAASLRDEFSGFGDAFSIIRDNIHYKLVLCDEKFKLEGGFNYLSFTGDYSDPDTRREGSPFGRNVEEIRLLRKVYFRDGQMEQ